MIMKLSLDETTAKGDLKPLVKKLKIAGATDIRFDATYGVIYLDGSHVMVRELSIIPGIVSVLINRLLTVPDSAVAI